MIQVQVEERSHHDQLQEGEEQSMCNSIEATPYHMRETRDGCHKGVLNGAFPTFHIDDIGYAIKGDTQVGPDRGPNQQVEDQGTRIDLGASYQLCAGTDIGH